MSKSAIIGLLIAGLVLGGVATLAQASDSQWVVNLKLYYGSVGSGTADEITYMGVRAGATDGYDQGIDTPNPMLPPPGDPPVPCVDLYFYRSGWGTDTAYAEDFRSVIVAGVPKVWEDIRATSRDTEPGNLVLTWTIGVSNWDPPAEYVFTLYDEGTSPDPTGGDPYDMRSLSELTFAHAGGTEVHYFHIEVYSNAPPTCSFTYTPTEPVQGVPVAFDGTGSSDPDGTIVSYVWDFDGTAGSGATLSHTFTSCGVLPVSLTVTDDDGAFTDCAQSVPVQCDPHLNWNCQVRAFWGAIDGAPNDRDDYFGVRPGATDDWDFDLDAKKPGVPMGNYVYAWFQRLSWGQGAIMHDWRSALTEGMTKTWGTAFNDTWNVKTNLDQGGSGEFDTCDPPWGMQYPLAAAIYLSWEFGVSETPPAPMPPEEYLYTLEYKGGINAKPEGTAPAGVTVPTLDQTWDMEATPHIVIPLWSVNFQPPNSTCTDYAAPDTARFKIIVHYPAPCPLPTSCFTFTPTNPNVLDVVQFTDCSDPGLDKTITDWAWDFGDGGTSTAQNPTHQYTAAGDYTVSLTVTNDCLPPRSDTSTQTITIYGPPTCSISYSPDPAIAGEPVNFDSNASDPDGGSVVSAAWTFGDTDSGTGLTTSHTYASAGTYTVGCTVTDDEGQTGYCELELVVVPQPPEACFTWSGCTDPPLLPGERATFDGSCSTAGSPIVSYEWDFGDGSTGSGVLVNHTYDAEDSYTVTLTVTDSDALTDTETQTVAVTFRTEDQNWNCWLKAYWGAIDGEPYDLADYFGVRSGATDGYELMDAKKPGEPMGPHVYAWFQRLAWGQGPIMHDWRSPLSMGTTKVWGTAFNDTWNVKTNLDQGPSGVLDTCDPPWGMEYPLAAAVYLTWEFGVSETPPAPLPPDEYEFTLQYQGGINPKPEGTAPAGVTVPTLDDTWDMETTPHIVIPLWSVLFQPPNSTCTDYAAPDTARFKIIVVHPGCGGPPTCSITVTGDTECATLLTFNANPVDPDGDPITSVVWDFGDGGAATGDPGIHAYGATGTYTVTCTVTDSTGESGFCETTVTITPKTVSFFLSGPAWHMIALPCDPIDPDPAVVFDELDPYGSPSLLSGNLHRFDPLAMGYKTWYNFAPGLFGGPLQVGEGYWLWIYEDITITYEACCDYGEKVIHFEVAGWHMFGNPQNGYIDIRRPDMQAELGASGRIQYCEATPVSNPEYVWIGDPLIGYDPTVSSYYYPTCSELYPDHELRPFHGYWADVKEASLHIYIPAP